MSTIINIRLYKKSFNCRPKLYRIAISCIPSIWNPKETGNCKEYYFLKNNGFAKIFHCYECNIKYLLHKIKKEMNKLND